MPKISSFALAKPSDSEFPLGKRSAFIPVQFAKTPNNVMNLLLKRLLGLRQKIFTEALHNIHFDPIRLQH